VVLLFMIYSPKKNSHEFDAVAWVSSNYPKANVFFNQPRLNIYAGNYIYLHQDDIDYGSLHQLSYDIYVIKFYKGQTIHFLSDNFTLIKSFPDGTNIYLKHTL